MFRGFPSVALAAASAFAAAADVSGTVVHSVPEECRSSLWSLSVEGVPCGVAAARTCDEPFGGWGFRQGGEYAFASFETDGAATLVARTLRPRDLSSIRVLPEDSPVTMRQKGLDEIELRIARPCRFSLEPDGRESPLLVFAEKPMDDVPDEADPRVRTFGPGIHDVGRIELKSGETLYLKTGAFVRGAVFASGDGIRICGHGVLDCSVYPWRNGPVPHVIQLKECRNARIDGIAILGAYHWTIVPIGCDGVAVRGVRFCGGRVQNDDGVDPCNSCRILVEDCFFRTDDDCIAVKGTSWGEKYGPCEEIAVRDCVFWSDHARGVLLGHESLSPRMAGISFERCDVLRSRLPAILVEPGEGMPVENVSFRDIRVRDDIRDPGWRAVKIHPCVYSFTKKKIPGRATGFLFENFAIAAATTNAPVYIGGGDAAHGVSNVVFRSATVAGKPLSPDCIERGNFAKDVRIEPGSVALAGAFSDNAVLQRGMPVPVWGNAEPNETVEVSFAGHSIRTAAGSDGAWRCTLPPLEDSAEGRTLRVRGLSSGGVATARNVLVGEVWFCCGQSNMEMPLWSPYPRFRDRKGAMRSAMTRESLVRFCRQCDYHAAASPKREFPAPPEWKSFSPEHLGVGPSFSAVAAYFALELHRALGVPVGVVGAWWGGTPIEAWTPESGLRSRPETAALADEPILSSADFNMVPEAERRRRRVQDQPRALWNDMVAPWTPYAIRGLLWYQGEENLADGAAYTGKMHALFDGWTREFENPGLTMRFVQLAPWGRDGVPALQMAQARFAADEPRAAMAVAADIGVDGDVHPTDKETVGQRLALLALRHDYGFSSIQADAPAPAYCRAGGSRAIVEFANAKSLYIYNIDRSLDPAFDLCGEDGEWHPATIENLDGNGGNVKGGATLILSAEGVVEPRRVRYLHRRPYFGCLYGDSNLPVGPFERTLEQP